MGKLKAKKLREFKEVSNDVVSAIYDDKGNKVAEGHHDNALEQLLEHLGVSVEYVERLDLDDFADHIRDIPEPPKDNEDVEECPF